MEKGSLLYHIRKIKMKFALALLALASAAADECSVSIDQRFDCGALASDQDSCEVRPSYV